MNSDRLKELNDLSSRLEQAIKTELQDALLRGTNNPNTQESLENNLSELPEQIAQSLSPVFNIIGSIAGPRITAARKQKVIAQINAKNGQAANKDN